MKKLPIADDAEQGLLGSMLLDHSLLLILNTMQRKLKKHIT
jgi:hypothetical protein